MYKPTGIVFQPYVQQYIDLVPDGDLLVEFANQTLIINDLLATITEEKSMHSYAPGKWTLKEMLQHIIDTERIFSYRAVCFARKETLSLPGFDENLYGANTSANTRTWQSLVKEYKVVRLSLQLLFKSFTEEELLRTGTANNNLGMVGGIGFISLGHFYHHKKIIEERYL